MCLLYQVPQNYVFKIKDPHYFMGTKAPPSFCIILGTLFQLCLILTDLGQDNSPIWGAIFSFQIVMGMRGVGIEYMRDAFLCRKDGS